MEKISLKRKISSFNGKKYSLARWKIRTKRREISKYLDFLDNHPIITEFLLYDCCFRLADNYLIAMVFVYFKRCGFEEADYTFTYFFSALLLAHSMVEEDEAIIEEIYFWSTCRTTQTIKKIEQLKFVMAQTMLFNTTVGIKSCKTIMSLVPHKNWKRERNVLHSGAPRGYLRSNGVPDGTLSFYDWFTSSCPHCREAKKKVTPLN